MEYLEVAEARHRSGLRLVLSKGVPGPWGESAKKIFDVKGIAYTPVAQYPMQANPELVEWTGLRNAPIAIYETDAPRSGWADILLLAEALAPDPPLLPEDSNDRATVFGISNEICGVWGLGWCRRLNIVADISGSQAGGERDENPSAAQIARDYGITGEATAKAPARVADILRMLTARLRKQREQSSPYLVGKHLTACDIHWACFSAMLNPMPHEVNPMPDYLRPLYTNIGPIVEAAYHSILTEHRDFVFETHLKLPLEF